VSCDGINYGLAEILEEKMVALNFDDMEFKWKK
jgi:hypothetical protein